MGDGSDGEYWSCMALLLLACAAIVIALGMGLQWLLGGGT